MSDEAIAFLEQRLADKDAELAASYQRIASLEEQVAQLTKERDMLLSGLGNAWAIMDAPKMEYANDVRLDLVREVLPRPLASPDPKGR